MISFLSPAYLWLLLLVPAIYLFYLKALTKRRRQAMKFSSLGLIKKAAGTKGRWRRNLSFYLGLAAAILLIIGLSDPHIPLKREREGVNVVLVLDVSGSMQAQDYDPTRMEAAKKAAGILIDNLNPKDNVGIVIFESGATTAAYLSPFKDRVADKLEAIKPKEGKTAIGDGLSLGVDMAASVPNKKKVIVLLSDGVNNAGVISPQEAVSFANANKIQVNVVGMGTEGKTVLGTDFFGRPVYAELDEATLKSIAEQTGGQYYKSVDSDTLDDIYERISEDIEREREETSIKDWFIGLAAIVILVQIYMMYGRYRIIS